MGGVGTFLVANEPRHCRSARGESGHRFVDEHSVNRAAKHCQPHEELANAPPALKPINGQLPAPLACHKQPSVIKRQAAVILASFIGLLASCDGEKTGSVLAEPTDAVAWSQQNPIVSEQTWAGVDSLMCEVSSTQVCGPEGCKPLKTQTYIRWHPNTREYERCGGSSPCDSYNAQVSYSGAWANVSVPDHGLMARLTGSGQFVEVATQMDAVFVYHGQCRKAD